MKNKKLKTKLAREIRKQYGFDFITSIKLAKGVMKDNAPGVIHQLGFGAEAEQIPACGRGCCFVDGETIYFTRNHKDEYVRFKLKDLEQLKRLVIDKKEGNINV